jgi:PAS domain S-box-containing protein
MKLHDLTLATRITIGAIAMVVAGTATLLFAENARLRDVYLSERRGHLENDLEAKNLLLNHAIGTLRQDVLFLSNIPPVSGIVRASLNHGYDARYNNTDKVWKERLQQIFSAFLSTRPDYYRIRYIGIADGGRELVRIDNRGGKVELTPPDRLQAKGDRDYFKATLGLRKGQVYFSEFNLNQDWGVIEQPYRPTLHATTPVFTPSGELFGMVVINMDVSSLLKSAMSDLPEVETYITNRNGQYLLHPDPGLAFQFEPGGKNNIATDFPFIKAALDPMAANYLPLQAAATKTGRKTGSLFFAARRIHFDSSDPQRFLLLMYYLPATAAAQQAPFIPVKTLLYEFIAMLLVGGIAMLVLRRTFSPLRQIAEAANKIAAGNQSPLLLPAGGGEIGSLTHALNAMLVRLSQRENLLQESESRYRRLHESMMDAYVMVDMSGRLIEFNHTYREMLGYSDEELQRLTCVDLTPEKWHEFEAQIIEKQVIPRGYSQVYEKEYIRKDGTVFPVEFKAFLLRGKDNQPEAMWAIARDITERKHLEMKLQRSEENLVRAQAVAQIGSWVLDIPSNRLEWSAEACRIFGASQQTNDLADFAAAVHPDDRDFVFKAWGEKVTNDTHYDIEHRIVVGGQMRWVRERAEVIKDPEGRALTGIGTTQDITERKLAEEELKRFFNLVPDLVCIASTDGHFLKINSAWQQTLGYTEQEILATPFLDLIHPDDRKATMKEVERQLAGEQTMQFINRYLCKDGSYKWLEWVASPAVDKTLLFASARDITERKQAEAMVRQSAAEIEDLYNHAPCGYHSLSENGDFLMINNTELAWLGYTRDEIMFKRSFADLLTPDSLPTFRRTFPKLKKAGKIRDVEFDMVRKDGSILPVLINATALYDTQGNFIMSRSTVYDMTERKKMEQERIDYLRRLEDASRHLVTAQEDARRQLSSELHDRTSPNLAAIAINLDVITKNLPKRPSASLVERVEDTRALLIDTAASIREIVNEMRPLLLDYAGIEAALASYVNQFAHRTGIAVHFDCINCDTKLAPNVESLLFRICQEALTNCAKHAYATSVNVILNIGARPIFMSITDDGVGFNQSQLGKTGQVGLGLLNMREMAEVAGGTLTIESDTGKGTCIAVEIS